QPEPYQDHHQPEPYQDHRQSGHLHRELDPEQERELALEQEREPTAARLAEREPARLVVAERCCHRGDWRGLWRVSGEQGLL
ncbi:MAG: hypothetical protein CL422_10415, partial [Acidimicrobiaceae bacterium]|nr:hypothetical protein [Acidimicrobiaceae bacterium]